MGCGGEGKSDSLLSLSSVILYVKMLAQASAPFFHLLSSHPALLWVLQLKKNYDLLISTGEIFNGYIEGEGVKQKAEFSPFCQRQQQVSNF